eukprot:1484073-Prymnesium_polylepis.1
MKPGANGCNTNGLVFESTNLRNFPAEDPAPMKTQTSQIRFDGAVMQRSRTSRTSQDSLKHQESSRSGEAGGKSKMSDVMRRASRKVAEKVTHQPDWVKASVESVKASIREHDKPYYIIDPRSSKFMRRWDPVVMLALIFTAIVTPYE